MRYNLFSLETCVRTWLRTATPLAGALTVLVLSGCGTTSGLVALPPVGPQTAAVTETHGSGILQVYSARPLAVQDVNFEEFFANNDFGGNRFPHEPAHTDYTILTEEGRVFERVKNARNPDDAQPAAVTLPAGTYKVKAQAKYTDPGTVAVLVPVTIQPGQMTQVHLDGDWRPPVRPSPPPASGNLSMMP